MKSKNGWITRIKTAYCFTGAAVCFLVAAYGELPTTPIVALAMGILFGVIVALLAIEAQNDTIQNEQNYQNLSMLEDTKDFEDFVSERRNRIIK